MTPARRVGRDPRATRAPSVGEVSHLAGGKGPFEITAEVLIADTQNLAWRGTTIGAVAFITEDDMLRGSPLHGWDGRFFHSERMTFARWSIAADAADLHEHHHEQEEVWNVVAGSVVLIVDGDERELRAGEAAVVPPHTPHAARVVGPAEVVVADHPVRTSLPGVASS